jgi:hypothetical protein
VIEVQVRVDNDIDLFGSYSCRGERGGKKLLILVNLAHLFVLFVADSSFDDGGMLSSPDNDSIETQENAVQFIGWGALPPERLGNDSEHGSTIEPVSPIGADRQLEVAD